MVAGLERFAAHFKDFADSFILIGGAACDLWMGELGLRFRATDDLDVVLVADTVGDDFVRTFWAFIREGRYATHQQSRERPNFYRFADPGQAGHPRQIELLTRNLLGLPEDARLTPIPAGDDLSSLSAIMMDGACYDYVLGSRVRIDGIPTVPVQCLIPLKAKAHLDLKTRKEAGDTRVKGDDVRKHRNDVFALAQTLVPEDRYTLPDDLRNDLRRFLDSLPPESADWKAIDRSVRTVLGATYAIDAGESLRQIRTAFEL